ncbi:MAG: 4-hydroxy-tetrahydrodipicolinate reductase [Gammaproteobacteria bacterium]|nr:4-hydroxy-tetrahydrodipicolinate reductase [Gammaproteobacteria bacterium]
MINVAVSGAMGRLGRAISSGVAAADDMRLSGLYDPAHAGKSIANLGVSGEPESLSAQVIVECTHPGVVMDNLKTWYKRGFSVVVGTSGFTESRLAELRSFWGNQDQGCLVVPNFSIGAVLMMHFAELASTHFDSVEIIERHENRKPDAPSGTALATAMRIAQHRNESVEPPDHEIIEGARGGLASGIRVHSLRMAGLLSDQEVAFSNGGETFSLLHRSTSYESFVNGALLAIRQVGKIKGVSVGLEAYLST